jgi:hypothetical protein
MSNGWPHVRGRGDVAVKLRRQQLYNYVASKSDLLNGMIDIVFS